jgi:hypothetical protein
MKSKASFALVLIVGGPLLFAWFVPTGIAQRAKRSPLADVSPTPSPTRLGGDSISPTPTAAPIVNPCCGGKPAFPGIASFAGEIAIVTEQLTNSTDPSVIIFDLANQNSAPGGQQWTAANAPGHNYTHPDWQRKNLGDVFGITVDKGGNIYVAATAVYGTHQVGSLGGTGGMGDIYKLDASTGQATRFVPTDTTAHSYVANSNKMPNTDPGLGNIHYSCRFDKLYVTNFEDGLIYAIDPNGPTGVVKSTWDHGANLSIAIVTPTRANVPDVDTPGNPWTPLARRVWAVNVLGDRCYYSVWNMDQGRPSSTDRNEIWSVGLVPAGPNAGEFIPGQPAKLEVTLPIFDNIGTPPIPYSNPVSDISFNTTGNMLLAERSMNGDSAPSAHDSRLLEYVLQSGTWQPSPVTFNVGSHIGTFGTSPNNSAGGCAYSDHSDQRSVWVTGDYLNPALVYGLQGTPHNVGNNAYPNSVLIDLDGILGIQDKKHIGDVEIPCPGNVVPKECSASVKEIACKKEGSGYSITVEVTNNTDQTATSVLLTPAPGADYTLIPQKPVLPNGSLGAHTPVTLPVTVSGGKPGETICFTVTLMGKDGCLCTIEVCTVLPDCCLKVNSDAQPVCGKDGTYTYTFTVTNNSGTPRQFIYFYPQSGGTITPDHFTLPQALANGATSQPLSITISGAKPGDFCFDMSFHTEGMQHCCVSPKHCVKLPECGKDPSSSQLPDARK